MYISSQHAIHISGAYACGIDWKKQPLNFHIYDLIHFSARTESPNPSHWYEPLPTKIIHVRNSRLK